MKASNSIKFISHATRYARRSFVRERGQKWLQEQEGSYTPSIGKVDSTAEPEGGKEEDKEGRKVFFDASLPTPPARSGSIDSTNGGERRRQSSFKGARLESGVAVTSDPGSFPLKIMCSTMPRAYETADLEDFRRCEQFSNLNPLDKGDFTGLEMGEIQSADPEWYARLKSDPFQTRFPGGESYKDLIQRLESCLIDMEQQVAPVLVVSHVSVLQCLLAYFRGSPVEECTR